jgi:hypothetical protein
MERGTGEEKERIMNWGNENMEKKRWDWEQGLKTRGLGSKVY